MVVMCSINGYAADVIGSDLFSMKKKQDGLISQNLFLKIEDTADGTGDELRNNSNFSTKAIAKERFRETHKKQQ